MQLLRKASATSLLDVLATAPSLQSFIHCGIGPTQMTNDTCNTKYSITI